MYNFEDYFFALFLNVKETRTVKVAVKFEFEQQQKRENQDILMNIFSFDF